MRFLIRDLFLITFFIAVAALYFSTERKLLVLNARLASQEQSNAAARIKHATLMAARDFVQADIDRSMQIENVAKQIESHFPVFQAKYSSVEPRESTTVSVRQIPMLIDRKTGSGLSRLRVQVPTERTVYLKYAIASRKSVNSTQRLSSALESRQRNAGGQTVPQAATTKWEVHLDFSEDGFATSEIFELETNDELGTNWEFITDYSESGPFEHRLQSGSMDLDWSCSMNPQGLWEMRLLLNQQALLTTVLQVKVPCNLYSSLLAKEQLDFGSVVRLPELFRSSRVVSDSSSPPAASQIHVWLDEQSSDFGVFPGASGLK